MGYDVHITRAPDWSDNSGHEIGRDEWLSIVEADPDLEAQADSTMATWRSTWFEWDRGNVKATDPTQDAIEKAVGLADLLQARAQGDDGEVYGPDGQEQSANQPGLTLGDRLANLKNALAWSLWTRWTVRCPFRVGGRVRDSSGREGAVIALNPRAEHGAGIVTVRFDDGAELTSLLIAPDIEPIDQK